jgi:3-hydroxyisobutyrate dehydrogenase-like beta-hydroxyacid dehydrogenase
MKIGFIGLGNMGRRISQNLLKAGFEVVAYDIDPKATEKVVQSGAKAAESPKEVAQASDIVITSLPNDAIVKEVILGRNGCLEGARKGQIFVDMSTVSPTTTREVAKFVEGKGADYLDASLSGTVEQAQAGTLTILVGGKTDTLEKVREVFKPVGPQVHHCGGLGMGNTVKLLNNLIIASYKAALLESFALGVKMGIHPKKLYEILCTTGAGKWASAEKQLSIVLNSDFEPRFNVDMTYKDLELGCTMAKEAGAPLLLFNTVNKIYEIAKAEGLGKLEAAAIIKVSEKLFNCSIQNAQEGSS